MDARKQEKILDRYASGDMVSFKITPRMVFIKNFDKVSSGPFIFWQIKNLPKMPP